MFYTPLSKISERGATRPNLAGWLNRPVVKRCASRRLDRPHIRVRVRLGCCTRSRPPPCLRASGATCRLTRICQSSQTMSGPSRRLAYPPFHPESSRLNQLAMSLAEFRRAFPGEGQHVEFKRGTSMQELQNSAVAFSNAEGGVILIGVDDDGSIAGRTLDAGTTSTGQCSRLGTWAATASAN